MDVRNFFEGPINLDLMILGQVANLKSQSKELTTEDVKKAATSLANTFLQSQVAINEMIQQDDFEKAYLTLKEVVAPQVRQVCLTEEHMHDFNKILFKIEAHVFALRTFRRLKDKKEVAWAQKMSETV